MVKNITFLFALALLWASTLQAQSPTEDVAPPLPPNFVLPSSPQPLNSAPPPPGGLPTVYQNQLYCNGPFITASGVGAGGADVSLLENVSLGESTIGFGVGQATSLRMADDFAVPAGYTWDVDTLVFFAYQTGSPTTSTFTGVTLRIWDGFPGAMGSSVVFGDISTNRFHSTSFTGVYRVLESLGNSATDRPIMEIKALVNVSLPEGTYWVDWSLTGSNSYTGPFANPIAINGTCVAGPAGNAVQSSNNGTSFAPDFDSGCGAPAELPFCVLGTMVGPVPALSEWALLLMALMLISIASAFLTMPAVATAGSDNGFALRQFPFSAKSYFKTLAYTLILLPVAYAAIWMIWGGLEIQDIFMAPLCLAFVAYIAHIWKK